MKSPKSARNKDTENEKKTGPREGRVNAPRFEKAVVNKAPWFEDALRKMVQRPQPFRLSPMLSVLAGSKAPPPENKDKGKGRKFFEGWIFEPKLDGQRCIAFRKGGSVRLLSRGGKTLNGNYPELLPALLGQPAKDFIVDGEVVAFKNGIPSFERLQPRMQISDPKRSLRTGIEVFYYIFDLLYMEGRDLMALPLWTRKGMLKNAFSWGGPIRYTGHFTDGQALFKKMCGKGMEGVIAKRAQSPYVQKRSSDWQKFKCKASQEFVIGGYTDPAGKGRPGAFFGALLLGYYEGGRLAYCGKVGTGFDERTQKEVHEKLVLLGTDAMAFAPAGESGIVPKTRKGVHWVRPRLVCEIDFSEWTRDGLLRHPSFKGLRADKPPEEVEREFLFLSAP